MPYFLVTMNKFPSKLLDGYRAFRSGVYANERELYQQLAEEGQAPETLVIACCDSRSSPGTIFNTLPGEIFVVRNVANLVPPYEPDSGYHSTSAALEFAVKCLQVKHIVVLGHCGCSGVRAALDPSILPTGSDDFTGKWVGILADAAKAVAEIPDISPDQRQRLLERHSIANSITNLRKFPVILEFERHGQLSLHGAWFDVRHGALWILDAASGEFRQAEADPGYAATSQADETAA